VTLYTGLGLASAEQSIALAPTLAEGHKALGTAYSIKGWRRKAVEAYQKAVEANPNSAIACDALGHGFIMTGEFDKALPFIKRTIALSPGLVTPCGNLGWTYYGLDDPTRAEEWMKKVLELQPDSSSSYELLILMYLSFGDYDKATELSQKRLSKFPGDRGAMASAARAELFSGRYTKAQEYVQKTGWQPQELVSLSGMQPVELGYIYSKTGRKDEAREQLQTILGRLNQRIEQGDESNGIMFSLAAIHAVQGNKEEALRWLEKAVHTGWRYYNYASRYPLLENIRDDERFKRLMDDVKAKVGEMRRRVEQLEKDISK